MATISLPTLVIRDEEITSAGLRLPSDPATPAQLKKLAKMHLSYRRSSWIWVHPHLSCELIGDVFGLKKSAAAELVKTTRAIDGSPLAHLVIEYLGAVIRGELPGPLGVPKTKDMEAMFYAIDGYSLTVYAGHVPSVLKAGQCEYGSSNRRVFQQHHAAFRLDFQRWIERE